MLLLLLLPNVKISDDGEEDKEDDTATTSASTSGSPTFCADNREDNQSTIDHQRNMRWTICAVAARPGL